MRDDPTDTSLPSRRALGRGAGLAGASQGVVALALAATSVVVARALGPDGAGAYGVVTASVVVLAMVASAGVEHGALYRAAAASWRPVDARRDLLLAAVVAGPAAALVLVGLGTALDDSAFEGVGRASVAIGAVALPFVLAWTFASGLAFGREEWRPAALTPAAHAVAGLVLVAVLAPLAGIEGALAGFVGGHAVAAVGALAWSARRWPGRARRGAVARLRAAADFGAPIAAGQVLQQLNYRADLLILNAVATTATTGRYAIALAVTQAGLLAPRALSSVVLPRVARDGAGASAARAVRHGTLAALVSGALIAAALPLVPLVFGEAFAASVDYGYLLLPGTVLLGLGTVVAAVVVGAGRPRAALANAAVVTPVTLVLFVLLIPALGAEGAAIASSISYAATAVLWLVQFRRATGVRVGEMVPGRAELADYRRLRRRSRLPSSAP